MSPRIRPFRLSLVLISAVFAGLVGGCSGEATAPAPETTAVASTSTTCPADATWISSPSLPSEVPDAPGTTSPTDCQFQQFAWQSFLFLVSPFTASSGSLVFEGYMPVQGIFVAEGATPTAWGEEPAIPAACGTGASMLLTQVNTTNEESGIETAQQQQRPVVDQKSRWVHFGMASNEVQYDYLTDCSLWIPGCFNAVGANVDFPPNDSVTTNSLEIKTAWRVMETCSLPDSPTTGCVPDDLSRYYTISAAVQPYGPPATDDACQTVTVGLVGFHVVQKTPDHPEWIWATFEHADNAPACDDLDATPPPNGWSFYDPDCEGSTCTVNTFNNPCSTTTCSTTTHCAGESPCATCFQADCASSTPTQVCTVYPTGGDTAGNIELLNTEVVALLTAQLGTDTPWQHYRLVGAEWTNNGEVPPTTANLKGSIDNSNSIAETYIQSPPGPSGLSGCFGCHTEGFVADNGAGSGGGAPQADFSHLFGNLAVTTTAWGSCPSTLPSTCPQATTPAVTAPAVGLVTAHPLGDGR